MSESILVSPKKYEWAFNQMKLNLAYTFVVRENKLDPKFEVNEKNIKARYIELNGLTTDEQKKVIATVRPRSTSNIDNASRGIRK
jgi:hypothetical protein